MSEDHPDDTEVGRDGIGHWRTEEGRAQAQQDVSQCCPAQGCLPPIGLHFCTPSSPLTQVWLLFYFQWTLPRTPQAHGAPKQPGDTQLSWATDTGSGHPMHACRLTAHWHLPLTILHLGAKLALLGIFKDRVMAGLCAFHGTVTAGFVKEGSISTWCRAARQSH